MSSTRSPLPGSDADVLGRQIADLLDRVNDLEQQIVAPRLHRSALHNTGLPVYDSNGDLRQTVGRTGDGTYGEEQFNGPAPPRPNTLDLEPTMAGIRINWNGTFNGPRPNDFSHLLIHGSPAGAAFIRDPSNLVGTLFREGFYIAAPLPYVEHWFWSIAVNKSGEESEPSFTVSATPTRILGTDLFPETITATKIAPDSIDTPHLRANAVTALKILAESIQAGHIQAGAITADKLAALIILAEETIIAGTLGARRCEIHGDGIEAFNAANEKVFDQDTLTGDVIIKGVYKTGLSGERIEILSAGGVSAVRFYGAGSGTAHAAVYRVGDQIVMRGQEVAGKAGYVYMSSTYSVLSYGEAGTTQQAVVGVDTNFVRIQAAVPFMRADRRFPSDGDGVQWRAAILHNDAAGADIGNSVLEFRTKTDGEAWIKAPVRNSGLVFGNAGLHVSDATGNYAGITASGFTTASSRRVKDRIEPLPFDALAVVRGAPATMWEYPTERTRPARPDIVLSGATLDHPEVRPEWPTPPPQPKKHFGPSAEDVPAILHSFPAGDGVPHLDLRDQLGVLWKAASDLAAKVDDLNQRVPPKPPTPV